MDFFLFLQGSVAQSGSEHLTLKVVDIRVSRVQIPPGPFKYGLNPYNFLAMDITETLYITNREEWRLWLEKNHDNKKEIWLIYYKKNSGKPRIPYSDAVEEALCFGWIDSTVKKIDEEKYAQRFSRRNIGSIWAKSNMERVSRLIKEGKMTPAGLEAFKNFDKNRSQKALRAADSLIIPRDLKEALMKNKGAWRNYNDFSSSNKKMYIWWVANAKRPETRAKRITSIVEKCMIRKDQSDL